MAIAGEWSETVAFGCKSKPKYLKAGKAVRVTLLEAFRSLRGGAEGGQGLPEAVRGCQRVSEAIRG